MQDKNSRTRNKPHAGTQVKKRDRIEVGRKKINRMKRTLREENGWQRNNQKERQQSKKIARQPASKQTIQYEEKGQRQKELNEVINKE